MVISSCDCFDVNSGYRVEKRFGMFISKKILSAIVAALIAQNIIEWLIDENKLMKVI